MKSTLVTFSGTDTAPICSVTLNDAPRRLRQEMCKSLSGAIVARGSSLDQPVTISVADLPAMLEPK
jgi:hypothetical protein